MNLLSRVVAAGFDALVTMDRSLQYQQNLRTLELGIVVVRAASNRLEALQLLAREIVAALDQLDRGQVVQVGQPPQQRHRPGGKGAEPR